MQRTRDQFCDQKIAAFPDHDWLELSSVRRSQGRDNHRQFSMLKSITCWPLQRSGWPGTQKKYRVLAPLIPIWQMTSARICSFSIAQSNTGYCPAVWVTPPRWNHWGISPSPSGRWLSCSLCLSSSKSVQSAGFSFSARQGVVVVVVGFAAKV